MQNLSKLFKNGINHEKALGYMTNKQWTWISRYDMNNMINNNIVSLQNNDVQKGDRVAFKGNNSKEWIAWNLAALSLGAIWVPMYPQQNQAYCHHILDDCQPKVLITNEDIPTKNVPLLSSDITYYGDFFKQDYDVIHHDVSTLVYTSGTTGKPKGVTLTHDNIISNLQSIRNLYHDLHNNTSLSILPWAHIYGMTCEMYFNLLHGNKMALASSKENFIKECRQIKPDVLFVVPKLLELIRNKLSVFDKPLIEKTLPLILKHLFGGNIQTLFCGGAKLDKTTRDFYLQNGIVVSEGYGCSETSPMISLNHMSHPRDIDSLGVLLDDVDVQIVENEICVAGPNVMQGYWQNEEANQDAFVTLNNKHYYKTGDSGYVQNNFLYLTGRISENYKLSNGKFVNVGELEASLKPYISSHFIVYGENKDFNTLIVEKPFDAQLLDTINETIDSYLIIKKVVEVESEDMAQYLTPKMSIKRKALVQHVLEKL